MSAAAATDLTERQSALFRAVVNRSSHVKEQLLLLVVQARTVGASERDVRAVRARLVAGHERECRG